jgi:predicted thioesterase
MDITTLFSIGSQFSIIYEVTNEYTAAHVGSGSVKVLSTPSMILFMEMTAHALLESKLPKGFSSVGVKVDILHNAATPIGKMVTISAEIIEIDRKRIRFAVKADDGRIVGEGFHDRMIIDIERFLDNLPK